MQANDDSAVWYWQVIFCLSLVITNRIDFILFGKIAVFVLRIVQCTNTQFGRDAEMLHVRYLYVPPCYKQLALVTRGIRNQTTLLLPFPSLRAKSLAVWPKSFLSLTSAPLSTRSFTTDKCPLCDTSCNGVYFHLFWESTFAPPSRNRWHISRCP